jgi:hypothetical protein
MLSTLISGGLVGGLPVVEARKAYYGAKSSDDPDH